MRSFQVSGVIKVLRTNKIFSIIYMKLIKKNNCLLLFFFVIILIFYSLGNYQTENLSNCEWGPYSDWSECSRGCGGGTQTRIRKNNEWCFSGDDVQYYDSEERKCNVQECAKGDKGAIGDRGDQGDTGPRGYKGPPGESGGARGSTGIKGTRGEDGVKGKKGLTGHRGLRGFRGPPGKVIVKSGHNNDILTSIYKKMLEFGEEPEKEGKEDTKEGMLNSYNNSNYN